MHVWDANSNTKRQIQDLFNDRAFKYHLLFTYSPTGAGAFPFFSKLLRISECFCMEQSRDVWWIRTPDNEKFLKFYCKCREMRDMAWHSVHCILAADQQYRAARQTLGWRGIVGIIHVHWCRLHKDLHNLTTLPHVSRTYSSCLQVWRVVPQ